MLSESCKRAIQEEAGRYPTRKAALLPALHLAQKEVGWLPKEVQDEIAGLLSIRPIEVNEAVSFYSLYRKKESGRHHIMVCRNLSCSLLGSRRITQHIEQKLGIRVGGVTQDGRFSLGEVECLGSCGTAPMMQIDDEYYENLTEEKVDSILDSLF
jgi:NADH-quinone oxidoreductase E subunit